MLSLVHRPRSMALVAVIVAAINSLSAARAHGQVAVRPVVLPVGTEVRIFAPRLQEGWAPTPWFIGRLVDADSAGVTVRTADGATVTVPRSFAKEFAVRAGPRDRVRSAGPGALFGAALGLLVGKLSTPPGNAGGGESGRHMRNGALIGAGAGVTFALLNPWHRWASAPIPESTSAPGEQH